jgi:hypothetical protein
LSNKYVVCWLVSYIGTNPTSQPWKRDSSRTVSDNNRVSSIDVLVAAGSLGPYTEPLLGGGLFSPLEFGGGGGHLCL